MPTRIAVCLTLLMCSWTGVAEAVEPFASPGRTDLIQHVSTVQSEGFTWEFFRNLAYPCSVSGYQTFVIGRRTGSDDSRPAPLWIRMRGGGVGYFDATGTPQPSANNMRENGAEQLINFSENNSLNDRVNAEPVQFRNLSVSMCSHDIYGGGDQVDPDNPNPGRHTNGLFATKAAIQFARSRYPTTETFLHGTSAGSVGSFGVAWSLQQQGAPVTGFVADSGVANVQFEEDQNDQAGPCARGTEAIAAIQARVHPTLADPANQPHLLIERGDLATPVFNVWSRDDQNSCGETDMECTLAGGGVETMGAMECKMAPVSEAIAALPPGRRSRTMRVCVRAGNDPLGTCARHVVTQGANLINTDPAFPADYNGVIVDWVRSLVTTPPPPPPAPPAPPATVPVTPSPPATAARLSARFAKGPARVRVRRGRLRIRCVAGSTRERRGCRVTVRYRSRAITSGTATLRPGVRSAVVKLRLGRRGRKLVAAHRRLTVRIGLRVSEPATKRSDGYSRRYLLVR